MTRRIQQLLPVLKRVGRMSAKEKKEFLKSCNKDFIHGICECVRNLLKGRVPLKAGHLRCLARRRKSLRELALKSTSLARRKQILQKGGFVGALIQPLIAGLGSLIAGYLTSGNATQ